MERVKKNNIFFKKRPIPRKLLKFIRVLVITRPLAAAALGAMETGKAAFNSFQKKKTKSKEAFVG